MDINDQIIAWLNTPESERSVSAGAELLLRLDRNKILYRNILRNPAKMAGFLAARLKRFIEIRSESIKKQQIRKQSEAVVSEIDRRLGLSPEKKLDFKKGVRPDHNSLPKEIKQLYVDNYELRRKMQQYNLEIRLLIRKNTDCSVADLQDLVALLVEADKRYRKNWKLYDSYGS